MEHHDVVIVGGGNAGVSLAARLLGDGVEDVALVDARPVHRYRPLLNYVAVGEARMRDLERPMRRVVPERVTCVPEDVASVDPVASTVRTTGGRTIGYDRLVLCPGLPEDFAATPGLAAAYDDGWAGSSFVAASAAGEWERLRAVRRGRVVFTVPPEPAPCGPTALKPLLMACDHWRRTGVLADLEVHLVLPGATVVGLPAPDRRLERLFADHGIRVTREARVGEVDHVARRVAIDSAAGRTVLEDVQHAHVVPHYRAPAWVHGSGLAADASPGLVDVDPATLRHRTHAAVWALGDVSGATRHSSGGGLRKQVDVLARNLAAARDGRALSEYTGYTVIPITTSRRRLMLVEIDREGRPAPSVPVIDLTRPRRTTWLFDRYGLPVVYFRRILRGKV